VSASQDIADALTRHRLWLLRYEGGTVKDAVEDYQKATAQSLATLLKLQAQLAKGKPLTAAQQKRAERARRSLSKKIRTARNSIRDGLQGRLSEVLAAEVALTVARVSAGLPGDLTIDPPLGQLSHLLRAPLQGRGWPQRLDTSLLQVADRIDAGLAAALIEGASIPRTVQLLDAAVGEIRGGRNRLVTLARTEVQRVANSAAQETYKANRDVIGGVQYLATLDSRTCLVCAPQHLEVYPFDASGNHEGPTIPRHPRCRCFYVPVVRPWSEISGLGISAPTADERRDLDGRPAQGMSFSAWLRRQDIETQREVLGSETRVRAFRGRQLSLQDFSDRGRVLRVGELQERL
jgi:SPP1 gp7 family putative phage head morphogenesis protein